MAPTRRHMCVHELTQTIHKYLKIKTHGKMQQSMQIFAVPNTEEQGNLAVLTRLNCDPACNPLWVTANITLHLSRHTGVQRLQGKQPEALQTKQAQFTWKLNLWVSELAIQVHDGSGKNQEDVLRDTTVPPCRAQDTELVPGGILLQVLVKLQSQLMKSYLLQCGQTRVIIIIKTTN